MTATTHHSPFATAPSAAPSAWSRGAGPLPLPDGARVVAILSEPGVPVSGEACGEVVRLARSLASRESHVLLCNLGSPSQPLDNLLGVAGRPGMREVLAGRAQLIDVAVPSRAHGFLYVPAGAHEASLDTMLRSARLLELVRRVRQRQALILLYTAGAGDLPSVLADTVDATLRLLPPRPGRPTNDGRGTPSRPVRRETQDRPFIPPEARRHPSEPLAAPIPFVRGSRRRTASGSRGSDLVFAVLFLLLVTALVVWLGGEWIAGVEVEDLLRSPR